MSEPVKLSVITDAMLKPCPYCHAKPFTPCVQGHSRMPMRYTHAERNR